MTADRPALRGVFAATVTPMTADGSEVNVGCVGPLLAHLAARGVDGFVPLGTTGEFPSLSHAEKIEVISECATTRGGRKLIAGCGSCSLKETRDLVRHAAKKGADAVLVPPPFYFRSASPAGIETFFRSVLEAAELPVLLYHVPSLTGIPLDHAMLERLSNCETLWGIKDTGGKLRETSRYLAMKPGHVLLGSDTLMLDGLALGVDGIISACANVVPGILRKIIAEWSAGRDAREHQDALTRVRDALRRFPLHAALKRWLAADGIDCGGVRAPLVNLTRAEEDEIRRLATTD